MKVYSVVKDSEIEWMGTIPEHWEVKKLKLLGEAITGLTYSPNDVVNKGEGILVLRASNIQNNQIKFESNVYVDTQIPFKLITRKNDILICSRNGSRKLIGKAALIDNQSEGISFGAFTTVFRSYLSEYLFYVFLSPIFEFQIGTFLTSTINQLTIGNLNSLQIPVPSKREQKSIVNYLKVKTKEIDLLLNQKQLLISLLEQQRQSIVTEAVTKGLDPNVKMKDSGVEWIGEIPEHWETKALKYCFKVGNGKEIDVELDIENESGINVYGSGGIFKKTNKVLFEGESVLFGRKGTIGKPLYVNDVFWTVDTMYYTEFYKKSYPKWFYYLLLVYPWDLIITQTALPSVVGSDVANTICAIPSFGEQVEIAEYLSLKDEKHFKLVENINNQIQKLKEYRQALIYEAVTGKIDVREMEID